MAALQENSFINQLATDLINTPDSEARKKILNERAAISTTQAALIYVQALNLLQALANASPQEGPFRVKPLTVINHNINTKLPHTSTPDDDAQDFLTSALVLELTKAINEMREAVQELTRINDEIEQINQQLNVLDEQEGDDMRALFNEQPADAQPESEQQEINNPHPTPVVVDKVDNTKEQAEPKSEQQVRTIQNRPQPTVQARTRDILEGERTVLQGQFEIQFLRFVQNRQLYRDNSSVLKSRNMSTAQYELLQNYQNDPLIQAFAHILRHQYQMHGVDPKAAAIEKYIKANNLDPRPNSPKNNFNTPTL